MSPAVKAKTASTSVLRAQALLDFLEQSLTGNMRTTYQAAVAQIKMNVDLATVERLLAEDDVASALQLVANASGPARQTLSAGFTRAIGNAGNETLKREGRNLAPQLISMKGDGAQAIRALKRMELQFFPLVFKEHEKMLRQLFTKGLRDGIAPRTLAIKAREYVGFTPYDLDLVDSFQDALAQGRYTDVLGRALRDGRYDATLKAARDGTRTLSTSDMAAMTQRYQERLLKWRAETWTRTATINAAREGQHAAWESMADEVGLEAHKTWHTTIDGRERATHNAADGVRVPLKKPFPVDGGVMTPGQGVYNCRCVSTIDFDGVAAKDVKLQAPRIPLRPDEIGLTPDELARKRKRDRAIARRKGGNKPPKPVVDPIPPPPPPKPILPPPPVVVDPKLRRVGETDEQFKKRRQKERAIERRNRVNPPPNPGPPPPSPTGDAGVTNILNERLVDKLGPERFDSKGKPLDGGPFAKSPLERPKDKSVKDALSVVTTTVVDAYGEVEKLYAERFFTTQSTVNVDRLREYLLDRDRIADIAPGRLTNEVLVAKYQGRYIVIDGNHRAAAAALRREQITARVVDLDRAFADALKFKNIDNPTAWRRVNEAAEARLQMKLKLAALPTRDEFVAKARAALSSVEGVADAKRLAEIEVRFKELGDRGSKLLNEYNYGPEYEAVNRERSVLYAEKLELLKTAKEAQADVIRLQREALQKVMRDAMELEAAAVGKTVADGMFRVTLDTGLEAKVTQQFTRRLSDAKRFLDDMFPRFKDADGRSTSFGYVVQGKQNTTGRAYALGTSIHMDMTNDVRVWIHELGHILEAYDYRAGQWGIRERNARRTSNVFTSLPGYDAEEKFYPGRYWHKYMGKEYYGGKTFGDTAVLHTEMMSMALEQLYADPQKLFDADPELFDSLIEFIRTYRRGRI